MNARPVALFALIALLFTAGLALMNGWLIALALPLAVYLGMALLRRPVTLACTATRSLSQIHIAPDQAVTMRLTLTNHGDDIETLTAQDIIPAGLEVVEGDTQVVSSLPCGESLTLEYTVRGHRGEFAFRDCLLLTHDGYGVFHRRGMLAAPMTLLIRPRVRPLRPIPIRPPRTHGFAGPLPSRKSGSGVDFYGLREYQMGDRMRWMNWRASARHERRLFTNEFEQERIADVGIILDARQQSDVRLPSGRSPEGGESLYDYSIQAAASLAEALLTQGNRVGLLIYGRGREGVFPGYGRVQRERMLRALGRTSPGHNYALENLDHLPTRFFPAGSQIVFIGPLTGSDDVAVLTRMRANGYGVMVLAPDPVDFEARAVREAPGMQLAQRFTQVERHLNLMRLRRVGMQVVDWRVDQSLDNTLQEALARQPVFNHAVRRG